MAKWMLRTKRADFDRLAERFGISPVLARIIRNRDVIEESDIDKFLHGTRAQFYSPWLFKDMDRAVSILDEKIRQKAKIRIVGDYDIDGVCATFVLKKSLDALGAVTDAYIPHRIEDGYGMNEEIIRTAGADGVDTILTCDNGIAAAAQVRLAKELGMTVIITDHHEVPYEEKQGGERHYLIPEADAVIDPKQETCRYPFSGICGAFVAYKLISALYERMRGGQPPYEEELLAVCAFATIGDVMELLDENRILVRDGLVLLQQTDNPGLRSLIQIMGLADTKLTPYHVGFVLGPCINATGRLDVANRALQLLLTRKKAEAVRLAGELKDLNDSRKEMTRQGVEQAICCVEEQGLCKDRVLVVYLPDCHESLAGIIAGRIREKYGKPTFVLTDSKEGVKGSGRSIEAYHMYDNMTKIKDVFDKYGGHRMAAGLSLPRERVEEFRRRINEVCTLCDEDMTEKIYIDVPMPIRYADFDMVQQLSLLEPYGNGNPKPLFAQKNIRLCSARRMGKNGSVAKFLLCDESGYRVEGICFSGVEELFAKLVRDFSDTRVERMLAGDGDLVVSIAYYPDVNEYRQKRTLQMVITHFDW
ncbi:MAG: single-stranded-DNA-specific exonuclease RecJ [Lachnospiraceae bacterium]|nr:single-stranded-DNA-specific exonuclease RecJ [Lachnospiraceae bacterium]